MKKLSLCWVFIFLVVSPIASADIAPHGPKSVECYKIVNHNDADEDGGWSSVTITRFRLEQVNRDLNLYDIYFETIDTHEGADGLYDRIKMTDKNKLISNLNLGFSVGNFLVASGGRFDPRERLTMKYSEETWVHSLETYTDYPNGIVKPIRTAKSKMVHVSIKSQSINSKFTFSAGTDEKYNWCKVDKEN